MAVPCYTSQLLDSKDITPETAYNIKWSAASLYAGGADTVSNLLSRAWHLWLTEKNCYVPFLYRLCQRFIRFIWL